MVNSSKLYGYTLAFFTPGFFQKQAEESYSFFSVFHLLLLSLSLLSFSLVTYTLIPETYLSKNLTGFATILLFFTIFLSLRFLLDYIIINILGLNQFVNYFVYSKSGYLKTIGLLLLPALILNEYSIKSNTFLLIICGLLFLFRLVLILFNNKLLVVNKLFYFILYLCTLEIAPLLILYKITTT